MADVRDIWIHMKAILRSARQIVNSELASLNLTGAEGDIIFTFFQPVTVSPRRNLQNVLTLTKPLYQERLTLLTARAIFIVSGRLTTHASIALC